MRHLSWLALPLAVLAASCGGGGGGGGDGAGGEAEEPVGGSVGASILITLNDPAGELAGDANLSSSGAGTVVSILLNAPGGAAAIHRGSCDELGEELYELEPVDASSSLTTLDTPLETIREEFPLAVAVHAEGGMLAACGNLGK